MLVSKSLRRTFVACCSFVILAALAPRAHAQLPGGAGNDAGAAAESPLSRLRQQFTAPSGPPPLEGPIDPTLYQVGPGDVFGVSIGGVAPVLATIAVTADGRLLLPDAGSVEVAGLRLDEARERVVAALRPQYQRVRIDVTLAQPRQFYVHVSGAVPGPGRHLATPVARLASVLEAAFADSTQAAVANPAYRPSLRNVLLQRRDGERLSLDLLRYFTTGDTGHNPYLRDGDVISVPPYAPGRESIFVDGAVPFAGTYAFRPGDTLRDLLVLATGSEALPALGPVRLTRQPAGGGLPQTTVVDVSSGDDGAGIALQPLDHLFVLAADVERGRATASGWIRYAGTYPIEPGRTTLRDLVAMAGGLAPDALARGAYLERNPVPSGDGSPPAAGGAPNPLVPSGVRRADSAAVVRRLRLADLDFMSRAYLTQELLAPSRVSVDLATALADGAPPVYLQDGDRLVVPHDEQTVYVFGQVNRPGFVGFTPGQDAGYYVTAAGGPSLLAADAYVIEAGTGRYLPAASTPVHSGDLIFLDRREDRATTEAQQQLLLAERQAAQADRQNELTERQIEVSERQLALSERQFRAESRNRTTQVVLQVVGTAASFLTTYMILKYANDDNGGNTTTGN